MIQHYTVALPVKAYIKKYVETIEGSTIYFNSSSMLCQVLRAFLQNKNKSGLSRQQMQTAVKSRSQQILIYVPMSDKNLRVIGHHISDDNVVLINRFLEDCFERAFRSFFREYEKKEGRYKGFKGAYEAFAKQYNIELDEDISLDGLKKMEYRSRKKETKENLFTLVPSI